MKSMAFERSFRSGLLNGAVLALLLATLPISVRATSIVTNGNFESLKLPGVSSQFGTYYASQQVTGWKTSGYNFVFTPGTADTTGAAGEYGRVYLWGPGKGSNNGLKTSPAGGNFIAMDSGAHQGPITQTISGLTVGKNYDVSFYWAAAQQYGYNGSTTDKFTVSLGSESETTPTLSIPSHGFSGWTSETLKFKATSSSEVLSFLASGTPGSVPPFALLDGVSMVGTPEPATWDLIGLGAFGGFARFLYSRKLSRKQ